MVIEEGPLLHEGAVGGEFEEQGPAADEGTVSGDDQGPDDGTVSGEDQGPDPDTVTEDGTEDDEHAVGGRRENTRPQMKKKMETQKNLTPMKVISQWPMH